MNLLQCKLFLIFEPPFDTEHDISYGSITVTKGLSEAMYISDLQTIFVWHGDNLHRNGGPAIIKKDSQTFYHHGVRH